MSADDGIYILKTTDKSQQSKANKSCWINKSPEGIIAYRVAWAQAIDNFDYYKQNEPHNFGYWLHLIWKESPVFYSLQEAREYANEMIDHTEYGINEIDALEYNFPGA